MGSAGGGQHQVDRALRMPICRRVAPTSASRRRAAEARTDATPSVSLSMALVCITSRARTHGLPRPVARSARGGCMATRVRAGIARCTEGSLRSCGDYCRRIRGDSGGHSPQERGVYRRLSLQRKAATVRVSIRWRLCPTSRAGTPKRVPGLAPGRVPGPRGGFVLGRPGVPKKRLGRAPVKKTQKRMTGLEGPSLLAAVWRRGRDSNPRWAMNPHTLSRRAT